MDKGQEIVLKSKRKEPPRITNLQKRALDLYLQGKTNFEITTELKCDASVVSKVICKYQLGYYDKFYNSGLDGQ